MATIHQILFTAVILNGFIISKMARPFGTKNIETPEQMWSLFDQYKTWNDTHPFYVKDWVGAQAKEVLRQKEKPLTYEGFKNFCRKRIGEVHQYFDNANESYNDYLNICRAIKDEIRQNQIEGGMAMIFNPSITQRLNGLVEKSEVKANIDGQIFKGINLDVSGDDSPKEDSKTS